MICCCRKAAGAESKDVLDDGDDTSYGSAFGK